MEGEGFFAKGPEGYERKALGIGISLYGGSVGQPGVGSSTGDFESWMKGALGMGHLSLKRLRGRGLKGSSFTGDPGRYVEKVSGYGHLSPWRPLPSEGNLVCWGWGVRIRGTLIDE